MSPDREPEPGLCGRCAHARLVRTPRSVFWLCERSKDDPRFERYPRLPVMQCPGFEPAADAGREDPDEADGGAGP